MSDNLARCRRCHHVFEVDEGSACPRCGTPWQAIAAPPPPEDGTYFERYQGTEYAEPEVAPAAIAPRSNRGFWALMIGGGGLLSVALIVGVLVSLGAFDGPKRPAPVIVSLGPPTVAPPSPTTPPVIARVMSTVNDPKLSAHILIQNRTDVDSVVSGHPFSSVLTYDCQVSVGHQTGILTSGSKSQEIRFVDGQFYVRALPATKWTAYGRVSSWSMVLPLFALTNPKAIELVGKETRDGGPVDHFRTTRWWSPDLSRMAMLDATTLGMSPDSETLDLWTTLDGKLVYASFSATNLARDGKKLLDIETTYTFTDVGVRVDIPNPLATPVPSASGSASASASTR
jgi:hypothetical protein